MEIIEDVDESNNASFLVHNQLRDVVKAQREIFMRSQQTRSLEKAKSVSQEEYDSIVEEIERERNGHHETRSLLQAERLRREFAEGEVEIIKTQMDRERKRYEECLERLNTQAMAESAHKHEIESQFSMIAYEKRQEEDLVHLNATKIRDLKTRLSEQKRTHRRQMDEANVKIQQEAYMYKTLAERDGRNKQR